jgi:Calcineurin-like phosphoesterase
VNIHEAGRVIVVSDPHGHPELIQNALDDAGFDVARDGLICAGDLVDGDLGPREAREELDLLKRNQAQILWGNHDVAVLLDYHIDYQREWSRPNFTEAFRAEFAGDGPLRWRYAARVQGVFVTHAGISTDYVNDFLFADRNRRVDDPDGFVERLNAMFEQAVRRQLRSGRKDKLNRIMGRRAPHRFRVFRDDMGPERVLPGVIQVAGHSAPETYSGRWTREDLAAAGLHVVDPSYHLRGGTDGFRYAVIEGGHVAVRER